MLNVDENELLTRVGPGTPMGDLLRQYWIPALPSSEFPAPDSPPKRMRLLGENLVMFRDTQRRMWAASRRPARTAAPRCSSAATKKPACAASTTAGSSTSTGACVDMPSEPAESNFKNKVARQRLPGPRRQPHGLGLHGPARDAAAVPAVRDQHAPGRRTSRRQHHDGRGELDPEPRGRPRLATTSTTCTTARRFRWRRSTSRRRRHRARPVLHGLERQDAAPGRAPHRLRRLLHPAKPRLGSTDATRIRVAPHQPVHLPVPHDDHGRRRRHPALLRAAGRRVGDADHAARQPDRSASTTRRTSSPTPPSSPPVGFVDRTSDPRTYFYTKANKHNDYMRDFEVESTLAGLAASRPSATCRTAR